MHCVCLTVFVTVMSVSSDRMSTYAVTVLPTLLFLLTVHVTNVQSEISFGKGK